MHLNTKISKQKFRSPSTLFVCAHRFAASSNSSKGEIAYFPSQVSRAMVKNRQTCRFIFSSEINRRDGLTRAQNYFGEPFCPGTGRSRGAWIEIVSAQEASLRNLELNRTEDKSSTCLFDSFSRDFCVAARILRILPIRSNRD